MSFSIFIPARYGSTRLPGKVLLKIKGKTILQYAYECAIKANPDQIIIATDNELVLEEANKLGAKVLMTSPDCPNGTARIAQALINNIDTLNYTDEDIIVNLQADEVIMPDAYINLVAKNLAQNHQASIATLAKKIKTPEDLLNPNIVKVVKDKRNFALYFSRAPIPYLRDGHLADNFNHINYWHHIGMYAYKVKFLKQYHSLSISDLEQIENLEQLRALWHGYSIHVGEVEDMLTCEINTQEDLLSAGQLL